SAQRLDAYEQLILTFPPRFFPRLVGIVIPGVLSYALAGRVLGGRARPGDLQTVLRGLPHNPTTEMDLGLWEIARAAREDPASRDALRTRPPAERPRPASGDPALLSGAGPAPRRSSRATEVPDHASLRTRPRAHRAGGSGARRTGTARCAGRRVLPDAA